MALPFNTVLLKSFNTKFVASTNIEIFEILWTKKQYKDDLKTYVSDFSNLWISYKNQGTVVFIYSPYCLTEARNQLWNIGLICPSTLLLHSEGFFFKLFTHRKLVVFRPLTLKRKHGDTPLDTALCSKFQCSVL